MTGMSQRVMAAQNSRDAEAMAALFAEDYVSLQPLHPSRGFSGRGQVLENWSSVFAGVPDFRSELLALAVDGDIEWAEWDWHGHYADGSVFKMRGVTILLVRDGLIAQGRLYMEPVEDSGEDIRGSVSQLYKPPPAPSP